MLSSASYHVQLFLVLIFCGLHAALLLTKGPDWDRPKWTRQADALGCLHDKWSRSANFETDRFEAVPVIFINYVIRSNHVPFMSS